MAHQHDRQPPAEPATQVDRVGHLISLLERVLRKEWSEALAPMNLTLQQYAALQILNNNDKMSNAALAKRSFMTPQSTNEMVGALEAKALVERQPDKNHGRIIHILISKEGKRVLRKADAAIMKIEKSMLDCIPLDERVKFRDQLVACVVAVNPTMQQAFPLDKNLKA